MNEMVSVENSKMVSAFGVSESGQLLVRVKGETFGGENKPDVLYVYEAGEQANSLFSKMQEANSKGAFYIRKILPKNFAFSKTILN